MIQIRPRDNKSNLLSAVTPVIAVILTMFFGGILFWFLGKNPFEAIKLIFWDPLMSGAGVRAAVQTVRTSIRPSMLSFLLGTAHCGCAHVGTTWFVNSCYI